MALGFDSESTAEGGLTIMAREIQTFSDYHYHEVGHHLTTNAGVMTAFLIYGKDWLEATGQDASEFDKYLDLIRMLG
jgi:hypothetical protein